MYLHKHIVLHQISILIGLTFGMNALSQSFSPAGIYKASYNTQNAIIEYSLSLKSDGTFVFQSNSNHFKETPSKKSSLSRGTWKAEKNIIIFNSDEQRDINEIYTLNFSNTKARIERKSPRNKSKEIIPDVIRIYESDIFWVKGKKLIKAG